MTARFPLYARILGWFFLNLLLLGGVAAVVVAWQLRSGVDSFLAGQAGDRLRSVGQLIVDELRERPRGEWSGVLERFQKRLETEFFLFANEGEQLAGTPVALPPEVLESQVDDDLLFERRIDLARSYADQKDALLEQFTRAYLVRLMQHAGGNQSVAARISGLDRSWLWRLLVKHGLAKG